MVLNYGILFQMRSKQNGLLSHLVNFLCTLSPQKNFFFLHLNFVIVLILSISGHDFLGNQFFLIDGNQFFFIEEIPS